MFTVYVLKSKTTGKIYVGYTQDLTKRLARHNKFLPTKKTSYTSKNIGPWGVVYKEDYQTREETITREKYLKSHHGRDWLKRMVGR